MGRWERIIVHADMDAFFASVEQLDHPELRGRPVLVAWDAPRSVVTTASYEARPFGVGSAMPVALAKRKCPSAVVVPPRFSRYREISSAVMEAFASFSPKVESLSLDEAFLDLSGTERLFGSPRRLGEAIKGAVAEATGGLTVSVGISTTKFVAKVASDLRKPDGLTIVPPGEVLDFLHPLPLKKIWGVGPKAEAALHDLGLRTVGDVARASPALLQSKVGSLGPGLQRLARGEDPREVVPHAPSKSVSAEETLAEDVVGEEAIRPHLLHAAEKVAFRLRREGLRARGLRVKLKDSDFHLATRQIALPRPTDRGEVLYRVACSLLPSFSLDRGFRLAGVGAFDLLDGASPLQLDLFARDEEERSKRLDRALDAVRARHGFGAVRRAGGKE